jgi:hypothetical protein
MCRLSLTVTTCAALLAVACSTGAGDGRVWGTVDLPGCVDERDDFDMEVDFFAADWFDGTLTIRLQHGGQNQAFSDGVILRVADPYLFADAPGEPFEVAVVPDLDTFLEQGPEAGIPVTATDSPLRATLYLNETCPGNDFGFTDGAGEIAFEDIYIPDQSKRIRGRFRLRFVDPRYWESPEEVGPFADLQGEFDFNYSRGSPAQTFPK